MTSTRLETATRHPLNGRRFLAFVVLALTVAAAIATAALTSSPETTVADTPSLERLRELASIYDGQQFGWVPDGPTGDGATGAGSTDPAMPTPTLEQLQRMADIYQGQSFGPGPLDD